MDFHLSKEQEMIRKMYREFAETEVKPLAEELDEEERFPMETVEKMAKLGIPQVSYAADIQKEGETLTIKRMLEDGYMTIKVNTPCLITCIKELNTPRYMSVPGIFECYSKPYEVFGYETLKDDPLIDPTTIGLKGSPTNIFKSFTPPQKGAGMMLEGADKATCDKLAGILATKHII